MSYHFIRGYRELWKYLAKKTNGGIDEFGSAQLVRAWFKTAEGEVVRCGSWQTLFQEMNNRYGTNFIPHKCRDSRNNYFNIALDEGDIPLVEDKPTVEEKSLISLSPKEDEEVLNALQEQEENQAAEEKVVEVVAAKEPDWKWIESLSNTKEDKLALDQYAAEEFDIQLNKRNTLENMIVVFKEALAAK
ncbi:TPA: hypothetical protein ACOAY7_002820 [Vibrio cholerae]|nr:hypothetical protein 2017DRC106_0610 [Vibrio phage ICP1]QVV97750.1 hypothetical protein 2017DRC32_0610 [Vibrio phage ICP1]QVV97977.1 hypothetical protein 2017DRC48_0610 [Vibrio phage ICP1]QVV98204.1 hypothetical protein 2017DRC55_0610 [Vibrio phage ICP1]QVV98430.1 hypothetical protein 2017DRC72_0605 [Vibrio phage ICP1]